MKNLLFTFIALTFSLLSYAQSFTYEISGDSVLLGNSIELKFSADNLVGSFEAPLFDQISVLSGPNMASSTQIINGEKSSSQSWSYIIEPNQLGELTIAPAFFTTEEKTLETEPIYINVYPNPDGILQNSRLSSDDFFSFDFGFPFEKRSEKPKKKEKPLDAKYKHKLKRI